MLNALIQLSTLIYGLMINFLAPVAYGLHDYGEFIAQNAIVLLIHRAMTIISEPLIRFTSPNLILVSSLALNGSVLALFILVSLVFPLGSTVLLSGLLMSASVLLTMQTLRLRRSYIFYLMATCSVFTGMVIAHAFYGADLRIELVMEVSAWVPSVLCVFYLFARGSHIPARSQLGLTLANVLRQVPRIISITAVMNLLSSALPVFLSPVLSPRDLGLFKVMTSIIQAAMFIFPVSTQTVLTNFVHHPRGMEFYRLLSGVAMLYFAAVCIGLVAVAVMVPAVTPYVVLATCLPVYYQAILLERHLTALSRIRRLVAVNLSVVVVVSVGLFFVDTLYDAALLYASGFTLYAVTLSLSDRNFRLSVPLLITLAMCPLFVSLMHQQILFGIGYGMLLAAIAVMHHRPTKADILLLWREL